MVTHALALVGLVSWPPSTSAPREHAPLAIASPRDGAADRSNESVGDTPSTAAPSASAPATPAPHDGPTAPVGSSRAAAAPSAGEAAPPPSPRIGRRSRPDRGPWDWRFVGAHYGTGILASLLVLPGSYGLAGFIGHRGRGLGPVVGAMLVGAFLPPVLTYTAQWAVGRRLAPRRERYWPGWLVHQLGHLGVFTGAVLGGADFRLFADAAPVVLADALLVTGLGSLTAEATRRPLPPPEPTGALAPAPWTAARLELIVPVLKVRLP